jgi:hypothetical protein
MQLLAFSSWLLAKFTKSSGYLFRLFGALLFYSDAECGGTVPEGPRC